MQNKVKTAAGEVLSTVKMKTEAKRDDGYHYMVVADGYWGRGDTIAKAMAECRKAGACRRDEAIIGLCDPEARLDDSGMSMTRPQDGLKYLRLGIVVLK